MVFISLPYFYQNLFFNNLLKEEINFSKVTKKNIFNIPINIETVFGSLPFSYWNGDINNNNSNNKLLLYNDIELLFSNSNIPIRIDCSNIHLTTSNLKDIHQNIILQIADNSNNFIELSDLTLLNYINENYDNYNFIFSKNSDLINPLNSDIINTIIKQNIFYLISLPDRLKNDLDTLKQITNKNKIEITIGNRCTCNNFNYLQTCNIQEQLNQYNFSNHSQYNNCQYINTYIKNELINEIKYFQKLGFSHFKIDAPILSQNKLFKLYLINNLIQPQYQLQLLDKLSKIKDI